MAIRTPGRSAAWVGLVSLVFVILGGAFVWVHLTSGSDGARLEPGQNVWRREGIVVSALQPTPGGVQDGDLIVAVDGRTMDAWVEEQLHPGAPGARQRPGQTVTYTILRSGERLDLPVTLGEYPLAAVLSRGWGTIAFALVAETVGVFVFLRRPKDRAAQALILWTSSILSATSWSFGLQIPDLTGGPGLWLYIATAIVAYTVFWMAGLHFALVFPQAPAWVVSRPRLIPAVYITSTIAYLAYIVAVRPASANTLEWIGHWFLGQSVVSFILLLLMVATMIWAYRTSQEPATRRKMRWVIFAGVISGGGGLLLWVLPSVLLGQQLISSNALGVLLLPFPLAFAIAIIRYQLFDIDVIINRTLVYVPLTAVLAGLYSASITVTQKAFQAITGNKSDAAVVLTTLLLVSAFTPVKNGLQALADRRFKEVRSPSQVLRAATAQTRAVLRVLQPEEICGYILNEAVSAFDAEGGAVQVMDGECVLLVQTCGEWTGKGKISVPLKSGGQEAGVLSLAQRRNGRAYGDEDAEALRQSAAVLAEAILLSRALHR